MPHLLEWLSIIRRVQSSSVFKLLSQSPSKIPRMDQITYRYLGFEMRKGEIERKEMMKKLKERIKEKVEVPTKRVEIFESRN